jgi:hypothetical protein
MPVIEYFSDNKDVYSTAMMFAYINVFKPKITTVNVEELLFNLELNCWTNDVRPVDVLEDIKNARYKAEVVRIKKADLTYPIIVNSQYFILDGMHRYVKHILENKKSIKVYVFDKTLMKKFVIAKRGDKLDFQINDFIELFEKRFRKKGLVWERE